MYRLIFLFLMTVLVSGCFAVVDNQGDVSRVKSFIITEDEALDLLDEVEAKDPSEKKEITFFKGK